MDVMTYQSATVIEQAGLIIIQPGHSMYTSLLRTGFVE